MTTATLDDQDRRPALLKGFAEMRGDMVKRVDRARSDGARYVPPAEASHEDIEAALRAQGLLVSDRDRAQIAKHFPDPEGSYRFSEAEGWVQEHRWLVVTFAPRMHEKVGKGCTESGWVFYCPKAKDWREVKNPRKGQPRKVAIEQSLFGTYGFLRPNDVDAPDWLALDHVDGLGRYLRRPITKEPVTVPKGEVEAVMRAEAAGDFDETRSRPPKVKPDDTVVIKAGPFAGLRGLAGTTTAERVKVLLNMLGVVELSMDDVEVA